MALPGLPPLRSLWTQSLPTQRPASHLHARPQFHPHPHMHNIEDLRPHHDRFVFEHMDESRYRDWRATAQHPTAVYPNTQYQANHPHLRPGSNVSCRSTEGSVHYQNNKRPLYHESWDRAHQPSLPVHKNHQVSTHHHLQSELTPMKQEPLEGQHAPHRRFSSGELYTSCHGDTTDDQKLKILPSPSTSPLSAASSMSWPVGDGSAQAKKARRKEQCRVNQANYRKRKRLYETQLADQITALEAEIYQLQETRRGLRNQGHVAAQESLDPVQSIGDFYFALEAGEQFEYGNLALPMPTLHALFMESQEHFDSMDEFRRHWLWYREQFDLFQLHITSSERLEAGGQVIIKISGDLHIQLLRRASNENIDSLMSWMKHELVCPVLQQFEFHEEERILTRITSEINWLPGLRAFTPCTHKQVLRMLKDMSTAVVYPECNHSRRK